MRKRKHIRMFPSANPSRFNKLMLEFRREQSIIRGIAKRHLTEREFVEAEVRMSLRMMSLLDSPLAYVEMKRVGP